MVKYARSEAGYRAELGTRCTAAQPQRRRKSPTRSALVGNPASRRTPAKERSMPFQNLQPNVSSLQGLGLVCGGNRSQDPIDHRHEVPAALQMRRSLLRSALRERAGAGSKFAVSRKDRMASRSSMKRTLNKTMKRTETG